jgi:hypothetical protein
MIGRLSEILGLARFKPYSLDIGLSPAEIPLGGITTQVSAGTANAAKLALALIRSTGCNSLQIDRSGPNHGS